ncbi:MAG: hypothetical protein COT81_01500 [Candidatus Buchananbacteria bacterium CG10_big_fil_rev_8_21_14_0_10_42_9]|uniref:CYTH domain-containing protein n=1 Tax=Candidatus Buchananbacteria bacterium CG10_big_fil_rev_8_21_14_0_10_42_9 TaxID=1974526 RepID=A0A2H0W2A9_9BACT|nr:MAG: hypothetical protein COT81_01500 [Candidatus Buchananbacteria bacterium CG10_big_fil_rev_8_21_14_0_10_42_9]
MIEVEKNFELNLGEKEKLIKKAVPTKKISFVDSYYDTVDYDLTKKDLWLRTRDGKFQLKAPLNKQSIHERSTDQYKEIENEAEIARELGLALRTNLADTLKEKDILPFATIKTERDSYRSGKFNLDFDEMDFGFSTFEVEILVDNEADIAAAENDILTFAKEYGIVSKLGHGKLLEYLIRFNPKHSKALVDSCVV